MANFNSGKVNSPPSNIPRGQTTQSVFLCSFIMDILGKSLIALEMGWSPFINSWTHVWCSLQWVEAVFMEVYGSLLLSVKPPKYSISKDLKRIANDDSDATLKEKAHSILTTGKQLENFKDDHVQLSARNKCNSNDFEEGFSTPPNKIRIFNRMSPNESPSVIRDSKIVLETLDENFALDLKGKAQLSTTPFLPKKCARETQQEAEKDFTDEDLANSVIDPSNTFGKVEFPTYYSKLKSIWNNQDATNYHIIDLGDKDTSHKVHELLDENELKSLFNRLEENVEDIYDDVVVDEVARSDLVGENDEETKNMEGDNEKFNESIAKMEEIDPEKINEDRQKLMKEGVFAINKFMTRTGLPTWEVCSALKVFLAQGFGDNVEIGQMIFIGPGLYLFSPFTIPALVIPTSTDNLELVPRLIRTLLCLRHNVLKEVRMFEMFAKEESDVSRNLKPNIQLESHQNGQKL
ncbi:12583_t:CDS:2 [Acaulospora colombiana]|uniref:12583_t:CDS:1 n=1 Tax=Acaulospora colombiana TaxID=27376 RepID=A0ACA9M9R8_9GLOM|nr:12583_t:CDS:2 [Acaulospora colombiana]